MVAPQEIGICALSRWSPMMRLAAPCVNGSAALRYRDLPNRTSDSILRACRIVQVPLTQRAPRERNSSPAPFTKGRNVRHRLSQN
jgi:hypothetical protein